MRRIKATKAALGKRLVILRHHYQHEDVFKPADGSGESLKLSRQAAQSEAEYRLFCGIHFMAEVADRLSRPERRFGLILWPAVQSRIWRICRQLKTRGANSQKSGRLINRSRP